MRSPDNASLPSGEVFLRTTDGLRLRARWYSGNGSVAAAPCYLLGHGFTGSSARRDVVRVAQHLSGRQGAVLALDFRGHGKSAGRSSVGVSETADIAAGVGWLRLRQPRRPIVLLGFSMGAAVVLRYAAATADDAVAAVVAVSGPGRWFVRSNPSMRLLNRGLETSTGRLILARLLGTRVERGWAELPAAPVQVAGSIRRPTLIVHGDADRYFGLEHPRMLAAEIGDSQLWIEAGMGHAESATGGDLLDRIDAWTRTVLT